MWRLRYEHFRLEYDPLSAAALATPYDVLVLAAASLVVSALLLSAGSAPYVTRVVHWLMHLTPSAAF